MWIRSWVCIAKEGYGEETSSKDDSSKCFAADQVFSSRHYALRQQSKYILACEQFLWLQRDRSAALKISVRLSALLYHTLQQLLHQHLNDARTLRHSHCE